MANRGKPISISGEGGTIVLFHGFTGTPSAFELLGPQLADATGFGVSAPLLAGHGRSLRALRACGFRDWLKSAEDIVRELAGTHGPVAVVGLSMGGTIGLNIAARHPELLRCLVTINAPIGLNGPDAALSLIAAQPKDELPGIGSDIKKKGMIEAAHGSIPVHSIEQVHLLVALTAALLAEVRTPLLALQSREDHVVAPANGPAIVANISAPSAQLVWLEESYHVATLDNDLEQIAACIAAFVLAQMRHQPNSDCRHSTGFSHAVVDKRVIP